MPKLQRAAIFLLLLLCVPALCSPASFDGDWYGGFERPDSRVFVVTHFAVADGKTNATIDLIDMAKFIPLRLKGKPLTNLDLTPPHGHFELADDAARLTFDGQMASGVMIGTVVESGKEFPFRLDLMAKSHPSRYAGIYQVGPGHFIKIVTNFASLFSFDSRSAQIRVLLPRAETAFICGPGVKTYPLEAAIDFTTNELGQTTAIQWQSENAPTLAGPPVKLPEQEVSFKNGQTTLAGTLVLPPTKGPHPAIVIIHGSGPGPRGNYRFIADFFAMNGVAALVYDKRGCGDSTGDWHKSGFDGLAGDALAGLELLRHRPDINPRQIGLWGASQGGWLVGLAASRSTNVAFIIGVSGPGITPEVQGAFMVEHRMKTAGYSDADLREALSLYYLDSRCARTDRGWDEFTAANKTAKDKPWYDHDVHPYNPGDGDLKMWQLIWDYDPLPVLRKVHCPVLSIFGEQDPLVPAQISASIWKSALANGRNRDVTVKIFPNADHGISDPRTGLPPTGFFTLQRDWLRQHVTVNPD